MGRAPAPTATSTTGLQGFHPPRPSPALSRTCELSTGSVSQGAVMTTQGSCYCYYDF